MDEIGQEEKLARQIFDLCRQDILIALPYLSRAILELPIRFYAKDAEDDGINKGYGTDGAYFYIMASRLIRDYHERPVSVVRNILHMVLHNLFLHPFQYKTLDRDCWDFATDAAVESVILSLNLNEWKEEEDAQRITVLTRMQSDMKKISAEVIYAWLKNHPERKYEYLHEEPLFCHDVHHFWLETEVEGKFYFGNDRAYETKLKSEHNWKRIERAVENQIHSYEKTQGFKPGEVVKKFTGLSPGHYDFSEFLRKFAVNAEEVHINNDEFDYVFYTYGMQLYGNMPLIEPLEYRDDSRIRDFVIAIDTSGSVQGPLVKNFLRRTWAVLKTQGSFFHQVNIHIFQCDAKIQSETIIHDQSEFDTYMKNIRLQGFGGTDFRPVFQKVNEELAAGEFHDLRGLLYFTDGKGIYPQSMPAYKTAFIFADNGFALPKVPAWAIRLVLPETEFEGD